MVDHPPTPQTLRKLSISRKVILGVAFTLVMLGLIALTSFISTRRFLEVAGKVTETREVLEKVDRLQIYFLKMESGVRGFLLSGDDHELNPYEVGQSFIVQSLQELRKHSMDNEEQLARVERLQGALSRAFSVHGQSIDRRREGGVNAAAQHFTDPQNQREADVIFGLIEDELNDFYGAEKARLAEELDQLDAIGRVNTSLVVGGASLTYIALLVACLFVLRDIAERRRAEDALEMERNLLRSIMDTIPDFLIVKDREGRYMRINEAYCRHLGLKRPEDAKSKTAFDFYPPDLAKRYTDDEKKVLESGVTKSNHIEPNVTRDGREIWLETTIVPLRDSDGYPIGLVDLSSDITQRREDDERLRHYAHALQRSNEELQNFASVASHDLQEPLRKIQAFGDRLRSRSTALGDQERDYITRMMDAAGRMQTLIQDLLKLSRVTTRALPFETCDLNEIARGVLRDLEVKIAATGAKVSIDPLPTIEGDPTQLRQLLQNLLSNGLKFQKPDTLPEMQVTCRMLENLHGELPDLTRGSKIVEIRVKDNGIGFDPQFAEQIFGPFKRLHTRADYEGSGIGLSVCRKITDRHRGAIMAESAEGQGAAFIITLPVAQPRTTSP